MSIFSIRCQFLKIEAYRLFPGVCSLDYRSFNFSGFFVGSEEKELRHVAHIHTLTNLSTSAICSSSSFTLPCSAEADILAGSDSLSNESGPSPGGGAQW